MDLEIVDRSGQRATYGATFRYARERVDLCRGATAGTQNEILVKRRIRCDLVDVGGGDSALVWAKEREICQEAREKARGQVCSDVPTVTCLWLHAI